MARRTSLVLLSALAMLATLALPASADHTDPNDPVALPIPAEGFEQAAPTIERGEGEWEFIRNFPDNVASDVTFFRKGEATYASQGTLGQGPPGGMHVGQRIIQLMTGEDFAEGEDLRFRADHGSAACLFPARSATGLQHDSFATPVDDAEILVDATDAVGRCHDTAGGGIELIDVSGLDDPEFEPREVHLLRFDKTTHTVTADPQRPWIVYANNSAFAHNNWVDVVNLRSCLSAAADGTLADGADLDTKREDCRPTVHRMPFEDGWTLQTVDGEGPPEGDPASCHDTVVVDDVMYCSGIQSEVLLDLSGMFDAQGDVLGDELPCELVDAEPSPEASTGAMATDCRLTLPEGHKDEDEDLTQKEIYQALGSPQAEGWELIGFYTHPGISAGNNNFIVPATEGVAVSHETRPVPVPEGVDREFIIVSDERGGGVVPGGASCSEDNLDPYSNGGLHVLDVTDPDNITYATMLDEDGEEAKAVWRGEPVVPQPSFCVVHRFRFLEGEQRIIMGYYTQGVKILDYEIDEEGHFSFDEVASLQFNDSNTWTADVFDSVDNDDGTRTYHIAMSDTIDETGNVARGLDVVSWTHTPNPIEDAPEAPGAPVSIERLSGDNRFETAADVSRSSFEQSDTVFVATGHEYADALAGGPLAAAQDAPILLTHPGELTDVTEAEIRRLGAQRAVILGGPAAVDAAVADSLEELGLDVERVEGSNRWATAAAVAEQLGDDSGTVFLVEGDHADPDRGWPDAMSAAPYAAFAGQPILLTTHEALPDETRTALEDAGAEETIVVGGSDAVSDAVVAELFVEGHGPRRLAGDDRYETNVAVYDEAMEVGMAPDVLWLSTGRNWPDALTAGAVAGTAGDMLVLVDGQALDDSPSTRDLISARRAEISHVNLLGGPAAISHQVVAELRILLAEEDDDSSNAAGVPPVDAATPRGPLGLPPLPAALDTILLLALAGLLLPAAAVVGRRRHLRLGM